MATLFNFRSSKRTKARLHNKIWRITRKGRFVKRRWGRAVIQHGRPKFADDGHGPLVTKFHSVGLAKEFVKRIVAQKVREGYDRLRRRRP